MLNFVKHVSIKNKVLFSLITVMLLTVGIGIIEFNRIVKMDNIFKKKQILNIYKNNFSKLINSYNKIGLSGVEIVNAVNQDNYVKEANRIKNIEIQVNSIYNNIENIDFSKITDKQLLKTISEINDSVFNYNNLYTNKIKLSINQIIKYKYLMLHPEQIEEDYKSLMLEQQNLGILSQDYTNRSKKEIIKELTTIYRNSIINLKSFLLNGLASQEFLIEKLSFNIQKELDKDNARIVSVKKNAVHISVLLLFLGLVLIIFISFIVSNSISKPLLETNNILGRISKGNIPGKINIERSDEIGIIEESINELILHLKQTVKFSQEISEGNFEYEYILSGSEDVLGNSLIQLRESLIHAKKEDEKRQLDDLQRTRENDGISIFSEILRQNQNNLKQLGREVMSNLIKFLKANQGVMFVLDSDEEEPYLNLISAYAWNREKFIDKRIAFGDGLIGSVAEEKFTVYMTDVPEDYIEIKSGTGSANPRSILIVPLKVDEEVLGVIEIASFNEFEQYEINIVEHIAENIASTLKSVRISDQTSELLEKFQIQASEMKEQEMALKNSIEELQKSHLERKNREEELAQRLKEINELNKQIQYKDEQLKKEIEALSKENEKSLKTIETQSKNLREIIDKMFMSVIIIKKGGEIEFANKISENYLGYKDIELKGKNISEIVQAPPDLGDKELCEYLFLNMPEIDKEGGRKFFIKRKDNKLERFILELATVGVDEEQRLVLFIREEKQDEKRIIQAQTFINDVFENDIEKTLKIEYYEDLFKERNIEVENFKFNPDEIIKWGPKYQLGISIIDNQHKKWISFINRFFADLILKKDENDINKTLKELKEYTEYHFSFEEKYMKEFNFTDKEKHMEVHKNFENTLNNYYKDYVEGDMATIHKLIFYLREWVLSHVLVTDRKYVELFKKHGIK